MKLKAKGIIYLLTPKREKEHIQGSVMISLEIQI